MIHNANIEQMLLCGRMKFLHLSRYQSLAP